MELILPFAVILIVAAIIGIAIFANHKYEQARTQKLSELAEQLGLQFFPGEEPSVVRSVQVFQLFNQGHGRTISNTIFGQTDDVQLSIFGYKYTVGGGKNSQTHHQTVCCLQSQQLSMPEFVLSPEHFFHRLGQIFGYEDINFASHPIFSKQFVLRGPDDEPIRKFFTPARLEYFQQHPGISLEANGDSMILFRAGKRVAPEEVRELMEQGFAVYAQLKRAESFG